MNNKLQECLSANNYCKIFTLPLAIDIIKNTGSRSAHIQIYDSDGHMVKNLTNLAAGKSHTFRNLDYNEKYTVGYSTHSMWGGKINLTISAKYGNIR